ncbi:MAG: hypothetical protein ACR2H0_06885 [Candidatus Limnocylindrales bacterium]
MHGEHLRALAASLLIMLSLAGCSPPSGAPEHNQEEPAVVVEEGVDGANDRVTLSARAAERLGIRTASVQATLLAGVSRTVIPYAAVVYEADGTAWAYQNVDGLNFVRQSITVENIDGDRAILSSGPPANALVVIVGAAELLGVEHGVGGGH